MIDCDKALNAFSDYVKNYDVNNGKIRLKIIHTMHVADLAEMIASQLNLSQEDIQLARLIGILHDIGRFEQLRRYNDFRDYLTVDHAALGVKVLQENNLIRSFIEDDQYDDLIFAAISNHNRYAIEEGLDKRTRLHAKIIRDADKTDIFRVRIEDPLEDALPFTVDDLETSGLSKKIENVFYQEKCIHSNSRQEPADALLSAMALLFDYNFKPGLRYVRDHQYVQRMVERYPFQREDTAKGIQQAETFALKYIDQRLSQPEREV